MIADLEFLTALTKTILQLCMIVGGLGLTVLAVVIIVWLFGGLE
jgi:hypothetical protein